MSAQELVRDYKNNFFIISLNMSLKDNQKFQKLRKIAPKERGKTFSGCIHFRSKTGRFLTNFWGRF